MKKFTKICLGTALLFIIMGGTLCIIGFFTGGWRMADEIGKTSAWARFAWSVPDDFRLWHRGGWEDWEDWEDIAGLEEDWEDMAGLEEDWEKGEVKKVYSGTAEGREDGTAGTADYEDTGIRAADVRDLEVEIGGAALYIGESEDDSFGLSTEGKGTYRVYGKDGTFHLEGNLEGRWDQYVNGEEKVYLYLPKGMAFREADIEVGGGRIEIASLSAEEIDLSVGAGEVTAGELDCTELKVETGAGAVSLEQVTARKLDAETGLGVTYIKGDISGEMDVQCGMGTMELVLSGRETDYNYEISCAVGSIEVGSRSYSALAEEIRVDNRAAAECSLECSMGEIEVTFTEP